MFTRITNFEWDNKNKLHIACHDVTIEEAEEVFVFAPIFKKGTASGRFLFVVFVKKKSNNIRVITARDMTKKKEEVILLAKIPKMKDEDEIDIFWSTHEFTDFLDDTEDVDF